MFVLAVVFQTLWQNTSMNEHIEILYVSLFENWNKIKQCSENRMYRAQSEDNLCQCHEMAGLPKSRNTGIWSFSGST